LKKCGVIDIASLLPASSTPARSTSVRRIRDSSPASESTRLRSCHLKSLQRSIASSGQYPGACETKSVSESEENMDSDLGGRFSVSLRKSQHGINA
jgi:hypothetical protein